MLRRFYVKCLKMLTEFNIKFSSHDKKFKILENTPNIALWVPCGYENDHYCIDSYNSSLLTHILKVYESIT